MLQKSIWIVAQIFIRERIAATGLKLQRAADQLLPILEACCLPLLRCTIMKYSKLKKNFDNKDVKFIRTLITEETKIQQRNLSVMIMHW